MRHLFRNSLSRALPGVAVIALLGGPRLMEAHVAAAKRAAESWSRWHRSQQSPKSTAQGDALDTPITGAMHGSSDRSPNGRSDSESQPSRDVPESPSLSAGFDANCICKPDTGERMGPALPAMGGQRIVSATGAPEQLFGTADARPNPVLHRSIFDALAPPLA